MVISCSIFQLHIFKRQIYANILDASAFPQTTNYRLKSFGYSDLLSCCFLLWQIGSEHSGVRAAHEVGSH
jgi:hypothetical protein